MYTLTNTSQTLGQVIILTIMLQSQDTYTSTHYTHTQTWHIQSVYPSTQSVVSCRYHLSFYPLHMSPCMPPWLPGCPWRLVGPRPHAATCPNACQLRLAAEKHTFHAYVAGWENAVRTGHGNRAWHHSTYEDNVCSRLFLSQEQNNLRSFCP